jgi:hypothetical protein
MCKAEKPQTCPLIAAYASYCLIIPLTGTLESLRRQTQERLDEGFMGLDRSGELTKIKKSRAIGVGLIDSRKSAGVFTSRAKRLQQKSPECTRLSAGRFQYPRAGRGQEKQANP